MIVLLVPVPVVVMAPEDLVKVQEPLAGSEFRTTFPVAKAHVGCVIVPTTGVAGVALTVAVTLNRVVLSQLFRVWDA